MNNLEVWASGSVALRGVKNVFGRYGIRSNGVSLGLSRFDGIGEILTKSRLYLTLQVCVTLLGRRKLISSVYEYGRWYYHQNRVMKSLLRLDYSF